MQTAVRLLCLCRSQLDPSQPRSDSRPAFVAERCAAVGARYRLGHGTLQTRPCSEHGAPRLSTADLRMCLEMAARVPAPWAAAEPGVRLGLGLSPIVLGRSAIGSMLSLSIEFVDTFYPIFKVFHGEIKQMLSGLTFACR